MDKSREIRLLIPPFFFFMFLALGLYWTEPMPDWLNTCINSELIKENILGLIAIIVGASIPIGFLIGAISVLILKLIFVNSNSSFDCGSTESEIKNIKESVSQFRLSNREIEINEKSRRTAYVILMEYGILNNKFPNILQWLARRWSGYIIPVYSATAILLAIITGNILLGMALNLRLIIISLILIVILVIHGFIARREFYRVIGICTTLDLH